MQISLFDSPLEAADETAPASLKQIQLSTVSRASEQIARQEIDLSPDLAYFYPHFFDLSESALLYRVLMESTPWRQDKIRIAGRTVDVPRLQCWMGDPHCRYAYSGIPLAPEPWIQPVTVVLERVNKVLKEQFNCVLLNCYRSGQDSVAWHADDEPQLGASPRIASVSFGDTRRFALKLKPEPDLTKAELELRHRIDLTDGSLLLMQPGVQERWLHQIPKTSRPTGPRINLTFRRIEP